MAKKGSRKNKDYFLTNEALNLPRPKTFFKKMPAEGREAGTWGGGYSKP